jgi:hypothetical protein
MPRLAVYAFFVFALPAASAAVSFVQGRMIGIVWVLLAGLSSNMAWFSLRGARSAGRSAPGGSATAADEESALGGS